MKKATGIDLLVSYGANVNAKDKVSTWSVCVRHVFNTLHTGGALSTTLRVQDGSRRSGEEAPEAWSIGRMHR